MTLSLDPTTTYVAWLHGPSPAPDGELGGKAANLRRLARAGIPVPPGFCLTAAAFRAQGESAAELAAALDRLVAAGCGPPLLAVRSSAIGEDGARASFAGQHASEIGVAPREVERAVERCWASLRSPLALAYRARRGLASTGLAMPVLVQQLVPAQASAVAFTADVLDGARDRLVLNLTRGLGAPLVAGETSADTIVLDRRTLDVLDVEPGDGGVTLHARGGALVSATRPPGELAVPLEAAQDLGELCLDVESVLGFAVDVEAALLGGSWWILQARPITTS